MYLALLWHQHQPLYKVWAHPQRGSYRHPWVRLHALRDYYSMAALVADYPTLHLTINLTPVLLWQLEDYTERGATDRALELTLTPAEQLTLQEREELLGSFFDASWHHQIFPHPRYQALFLQRRAQQPFTPQELRDLQMWSNLAWFGQEFREGAVRLVTGEVTSVHGFVAQGSHFSQQDVEAMVAEQYKLMRAVVPLHRLLLEQGQLEVSTTPFYHPILPLLVDSDGATMDRPEATHPRRFTHPEDAEAQVQLAIASYQHWFGCAPRGMWPAEGAVSQSVLPLFARHGIQWIATDQGVLARSGRWGYAVEQAEVLCQPYRAEAGEEQMSVFFRDTSLSDAIGFRYAGYSDYRTAASDFIRQVKARAGWPSVGAEGRVLTVVLDGENAWGSYRDDGRPFLRALYEQLSQDADLQTVTFSDYLAGSEVRGVAPHPLAGQTKVYDLFTGSWIDEQGSAPGVDLGTWVGEPEENQAWALLGQARDFLTQQGATPATAPAAFAALYAAEGSDWFWWFGADQESGNDGEFDDLFRQHLGQVYHALGAPPPAELSRHIVSRTVRWTFTQPVASLLPGDRLTIQANCSGDLTWSVDEKSAQRAALAPAGGVMAGPQRYYLTLGPFPAAARHLHFSFACTHPGCPGDDLCCQPTSHTVGLIQP